MIIEIENLVRAMTDEELRLLLPFVKHIAGENGKLNPDNKNVLAVVPKVLKLQNDKERVYGSSYKKYGNTSIFFNLGRKTDRIENIMSRVFKDGEAVLSSEESGSSTETFTDTVVDIASYALLWATYLRETQPKQFQRFLEFNDLLDKE